MIACYLLDPITRNIPCCSWLPFMPYEPTPKDEYKRMANQRWTEKVAQLNPTVRLRDMIIPATHDVGTYGIRKSEFFYFAAVTQRANIYEQLVAGSRSLDFRYGSKGDKREDVFIFHGPYQGPQFLDILQQVNRFITENPNEFMVISFQQENPLNDAQKDYLTELIQTYLTPRAITKRDSTTWFDLNTTTIGQVYQNRKNFFVIADSHFCLLNARQTEQSLVDYEAMGVYESDFFYMSSWANKDTVDKLWPYELYKIRKYRNLKSSFVCTQTMLTLQTKEKNIEEYIIGTESLRLDHFTKELKKDHNMANFFLKNMDQEAFNFVELDYIDYNPTFVKYLIGLNFPHKLTIVSAKADAVDVTQQTTAMVSRGRVLYIPNFQKSLGLSSKPKEFFIEFMYEGDSVTTSKKLTTKDINHEFALSYIDISKPAIRS